MTKKYSVHVDDELFEITADGAGNRTVDGRKMEIDLVQVREGVFSVIFEGAVYDVSFPHWDSPTGENGASPSMTLLVNGRPRLVKVEDGRSRLLTSVLGKSTSVKSEVTVRAPMPGLITKIEIQEGETIREGQGLVILEAMKMENEIRSSGNATVKSVHVRLRQSVEKGEPLITLSSV